LTTVSESTPHRIFEGSSCHWLLVRIRVDVGDFDVAGFKAETGAEEDGRRKFVTCAPRTMESADYHLHVTWQLNSKRLTVTTEFVKGPKEHADDEHEPYAEQFMGWLSRFFPGTKVDAEVHAEFRYPLKNWITRFLLPLKAAIGPDNSEAEIDGISCRLPSRPAGVDSVWLIQEFRNVSIHLKADREIDISTFEARREIATLNEVAGGFVKERTEKLQ